MADRIIMPKTGMAMEEGIILEWLKNEGDAVSRGDVVAEIETDKSTMELESDYDGTLLKILYPAGTTVPVVKTIAWIGTPGEELPVEEEAVREPEEAEKAPSAEVEAAAEAAPAAEEIMNGRIRATPAARRAAAERGINLADAAAGGRHGEIREADVLAVQKPGATPLAARIAADQQIRLSGVAGSGHAGKIFKSDITALAGIAPEAAASEPVYEDKLVKLTGIQKITGARMLQSHSEIPVVTENTKADVTELLSIRKSLNSSLQTPVSINDFVMLAAARALRLNPRMNSELRGDSLLYKGNINLGMAVATERGLLVPVIKDADMYSLTGISSAARALAEKGREGRLKPEDMQSGTFTVSNIGMYGVTSFTPIINQPEAGILGVCAVEDQLKMVDDEIVNRKIMGLSLTFDHRVVDGAEGCSIYQDSQGLSGSAPDDYGLSLRRF